MEAGFKVCGSFVFVQSYQTTGVVLYAGAIGDDNHMHGFVLEKQTNCHIKRERLFLRTAHTFNIFKFCYFILLICSNIA